MRIRSVLVAIACFGAIACSKGSSKLEGRWRGVRADGVPAEAQTHANTFALGTEIVARGNQITISYPGGAKPSTATYTVDKEDATALVIHTDKDPTVETFSFSDPKTMTWRIDERRSILFRKVE